MDFLASIGELIIETLSREGGGSVEKKVVRESEVEPYSRGRMSFAAGERIVAVRVAHGKKTCERPMTKSGTVAAHVAARDARLQGGRNWFVETALEPPGTGSIGTAVRRARRLDHRLGARARTRRQ
jgi:hypothetical protein